jgi:hypothetical protein
MTVNYTTNLALGQPVTGTESGTWGDDVNNSITAYLDIAIAGSLSIAITTADVTLANTQGTSSATNIGSTTAQYAILNITGAKTAARNLNLPVTSKSYIINNSAATGGFLLTVRGVTPTTGITLVDGEKAIVAWNGSDYVKITTSVAAAAEFTSGTRITFNQTAAPTGWTKSTTDDNKALRVVTGTVGTGGTTAFTTVFSNQTPTITTSGLSAGATTLTTAQMPAHTHTTTNSPCVSGTGGYRNGNPCGTTNTSSTGGGGSHTHTISGSATSSAITLNVQYVDVIIAAKN